MSEARSSRSNNRNRSSNDGSDVREQAGSLGSDPDVVDRHRKIEAEGEPVSIAESLNPNEVTPPEGKLKAPSEIDVGNAMLLQRMPIDELVEQAAKEGVEQPEDLRRNELVFQILKQRVKNCGIIWGEGTLQILPDGFGFLRSAEFHYVSCPDDIYVSPSQIRKFNLRNGSIVRGQVRPPKSNERYFALLRVESVNGRDPGEASRQKQFDDLTPLHPEQRIVMEHSPKCMSTRVVDLIAPIGFGQRGLIVSPPRAGKTILMQRMAKATLANYPDAYVVILLIDERPEEVTDMEREVKSDRCEVVSSTFDEPASRHIQVAEMVLEKAKRLVESGYDVVIFLDSITRLGRAWNSECPQSGKTLSGGLDVNALQRPKAFFGSARRLEEGGSLTILATALVDTGSKMDDVIFEEFKGTGNLEIVLTRTLVDRRIWPAIDINASGTRREEKLFGEEQYDQVCILRRALADLETADAMDQLTTRLKKSDSNADFLKTLQPGTI